MPEPPREDKDHNLTGDEAAARIAELEARCRQLAFENKQLQALRGSLHAFISAHPDLGFIFDSDGTYLEIIAPHEDLLYAEYGKLKGKRFDDLYPPEEAIRYLTTVRRTIETGQPQQMEYQMQVPAGLRWFEGRTFPITPSVADKPTVVWISRDITERKATEQELREARELLEQRVRQRTEDLAASERALRRSEQQLRSVLSNLPGVIYRINGGFDGRIDYVSDRIIDICGLSAEEWVGRPAEQWRDFTEAEDLAAMRHVLEQEMSEGKTYQMEYRVRHVNGQTHWVEDRGKVFRDESGQLYFDGLILDITPRKEAEHALAELHGQMTAAEEEYRHEVARDLHDSTGQKLVALMLNLRSVGDELAEGSPVDADLLNHLSNACAEIIREIRELCHGLYPPLLEERGLILPVRSLLARYERLGLEMRLDVEPALEEARFGRDIEIALFRICQEAINNVVCHSQARNAVVRLAQQDGELILSVHDDGRGLDPESGEGLGLKTMRDRMRSIGGSMRIDSRPGQTCICASVPLNR